MFGHIRTIDANIWTCSLGCIALSSQAQKVKGRVPNAPAVAPPPLERHVASSGSCSSCWIWPQISLVHPWFTTLFMELRSSTFASGQLHGESSIYQAARCLHGAFPMKGSLLFSSGFPCAEAGHKQKRGFAVRIAGTCLVCELKGFGGKPKKGYLEYDGTCV